MEALYLLGIAFPTGPLTGVFPSTPLYRHSCFTARINSGFTVDSLQEQARVNESPNSHLNDSDLESDTEDETRVEPVR